MTENNARVIPTINAVDNFNPADFTRQLPNEDGNFIAVGILFEIGVDSGMVFQFAELCASGYCLESLSDGIHYPFDEDQYAGCFESGLCPYSKGKRREDTEGYL